METVAAETVSRGLTKRTKRVQYTPEVLETGSQERVSQSLDRDGWCRCATWFRTKLVHTAMTLKSKCCKKYKKKAKACARCPILACMSPKKRKKCLAKAKKKLEKAA